MNCINFSSFSLSLLHNLFYFSSSVPLFIFPFTCLNCVINQVILFACKWARVWNRVMNSNSIQRVQSIIKYQLVPCQSNIISIPLMLDHLVPHGSNTMSIPCTGLLYCYLLIEWYSTYSLYVIVHCIVSHPDPSSSRKIIRATLDNIIHRMNYVVNTKII